MNDELKIKNNELGGKMNYRYRTDEEMKDSGIEWIGKIPKEWSIKPVKYLANKNQYYPIGDGDHGSIKPEMYQDEGVPYIRVQNLSWGNELNFEGMVYISEKVNNDNKKSILKPKDILIAKTGATIGKTAIIPEGILEANTTSSVGKVTVDHSKVDYKYVAYYFQSLPFLTQINMTAYQKSAQPGFNIDDLIDYKVSLPEDIRKQREISDFLDKKTAQFDSIISKKEALIEKLEEAKKSLISEVVTGKVKVVKSSDDGYELVERKKEEMKDCGVEWLGEIPNGWEFKSIKYSMDVLNGKEIEDEHLNIDKLIAVFGSGGIFKYTSEVLYNEPSVLFGRKGTIGKPIYVEEPFWTVDTMYYTKIKKNTIPKYMYYMLIIYPWDRIITKTALPSIVASDVLKTKWCLPSLNEQNCIVEYLDTQFLLINKLINKIKKQIEKLKEAKQSLISEAVTGKIEILD